MLNSICPHASILSLKTNPTIIKKKLLSSTTQVSFQDHIANINTQTDDIVTSSCLGTLFSNFNKATIENKIFNKINKPIIHAKYIDDIFIQTKSVNAIIELLKN